MAYAFAMDRHCGMNTRMPLAEKIPWLATAAKGKRWLVGVSGGTDSVALLHLLVEAGFRRLVVCHLDHGLRGRASTADAKFVARLAGRLGLECEQARSDVKARMKQSGESMETAARHARHDFFAACAGKYRCPRILLAHHADDQAETVLWNLLRGSHGLKGMRATQSLATASGKRLEFTRPLLEVRRAELQAWLLEAGHSWREDASNALPVAIRNRLRNEALPLLSEISGRDAVAGLLKAMEDPEETDELESWIRDQANAMDPQGRLHVPALRLLPVAVRRLVLRDYLKDHGVAPDRDLISRVSLLLDPDGAPSVNLPGGGRLRRKDGRLWVDGR